LANFYENAKRFEIEIKSLKLFFFKLKSHEVSSSNYVMLKELNLEEITLFSAKIFCSPKHPKVLPKRIFSDV
jgi:hypothetical protein